MQRASIDLGTNTIRLLIAEVDASNLEAIEYHRAITRLGGGYTEAGGIAREAVARTLEALRGFRAIIDSHAVVPSEVVASATSVVRRAVNGGAFTAEVLRETGIDLKVISGDEEARISLIGMLSALDKDVAEKRHLAIDIGGGSTEFVISEGGALKAAWSMEMGVVHLSESRIKEDPPAGEELSLVKNDISETFDKLISNMKDNAIPIDYFRENSELIGTAGTVTSLAAIDLGLSEYDREAVNNHVITRGKVEALYEKLSAMTLTERSKIPELEGGREDLIIPGLLIIIETMTRFGFDSIRAIDAGLLEGLLLT